MFNFIFVFRIQIDPWASNSFAKKNAWSIYKGVELSSEKVWTFSIRFTCNCPQYFFNTSKSKLHRLYWLAFASIRDCYDKKFSQYFPVGRVKVSSLSFLIRSSGRYSRACVDSFRTRLSWNDRMFSHEISLVYTSCDRVTYSPWIFEISNKSAFKINSKETGLKSS